MNCSTNAPTDERKKMCSIETAEKWEIIKKTSHTPADFLIEISFYIYCRLQAVALHSSTTGEQARLLSTLHKVNL